MVGLVELTDDAIWVKCSVMVEADGTRDRGGLSEKDLDGAYKENQGGEQLTHVHLE